MSKMLLVTALMSAAMVSAPAMAAPGGVVGGVVGTVEAVLRNPGGTVSNVLTALPAITNVTVSGATNALNAVPPILLGTPGLQNTRQSIIVPLPGPAFLNVTVANIPGALSVRATAAGPVVVTITTGNP